MGDRTNSQSSERFTRVNKRLGEALNSIYPQNYNKPKTLRRLNGTVLRCHSTGSGS